MSGSLSLVPDERLLIQGAILLIALFLINFYFVQPLRKLVNERTKRTSGKVIQATEDEEKALALERFYDEEIKKQMDEAKSMRISEILSGQAEAQGIITVAQAQAAHKIDKAMEELHSHLEQEKVHISRNVDDLAQLILKKAGIMVLVSCWVYTPHVFPSEGPVDFIYGFFWPIFQFFVYIGILWFFGRKVVSNILRKNRADLEVQLSEAQGLALKARERALVFEKKVNELQVEIERMRDEYVNDGLKERSRIIEESENAARNILKEADKACSDIVKRAQQDLMSELVNKAVALAEQKLKSMNLHSVEENLRGELLQGCNKVSKSS